MCKTPRKQEVREEQEHHRGSLRSFFFAGKTINHTNSGDFVTVLSVNTSQNKAVPSFAIASLLT